MNKLDAAHRRHLRRLAGIFHPHHISNFNLYELCGNLVPVSEEVAMRRWTLFLHVLRMPRDTPAQMALDVALRLGQQGRIGAKIHRLLHALRGDVRKHLLRSEMKNPHDLEELRREARKMKKARTIAHSKNICHIVITILYIYSFEKERFIHT